MVTTLQEAMIIIVEDDPNSYMATTELLKMHGATQVRAFTDGQSTLTFVEALDRPVDLFLVDIHMPGETGYDLVRQLRQLPQAEQAQLVALTAGVLFDDIRRARAAGFDGFIGKPIKPHEFAHQLERILAKESVWEWR